MSLTDEGFYSAKRPICDSCANNFKSNFEGLTTCSKMKNQFSIQNKRRELTRDFFECDCFEDLTPCPHCKRHLDSKMIAYILEKHSKHGDYSEI